MSIAKTVVIYVLYLYLLLLIGRLVFSWIQAFSRSWQPRGLVLVVAEGIYTATDPPLRFLSRYLRPVRLGTVALDLSFTVVFLAIIVLIQVVQLS